VENVTERQIAWLAGIIDGEGCLAICKVRRPKDSRNGIGYYTMVSITNANLDIINTAEKIIAKIIGKNPAVYTPRTYGEELRQCFRVILRARIDIVKLLSVIYSDLVGKRAQADLLIDFCMRRLNSQKVNGRYAEYTKSEHEIVSKIKRMNHLPTVESCGESPSQEGEGELRTTEGSVEVAETSTRLFH